MWPIKNSEKKKRFVVLWLFAIYKKCSIYSPLVISLAAKTFILYRLKIRLSVWEHRGPYSFHRLISRLIWLLDAKLYLVSLFSLHQQSNMLPLKVVSILFFFINNPCMVKSRFNFQSPHMISVTLHFCRTSGQLGSILCQGCCCLINNFIHTAKITGVCMC